MEHMRRQVAVRWNAQKNSLGDNLRQRLGLSSPRAPAKASLKFGFVHALGTCHLVNPTNPIYVINRKPPRLVLICYTRGCNNVSGRSPMRYTYNTRAENCQQNITMIRTTARSTP